MRVIYLERCCSLLGDDLSQLFSSLDWETQTLYVVAGLKGN